jgi:Zn-dependent peptidase ImmA (M78 family)
MGIVMNITKNILEAEKKKIGIPVYELTIKDCYEKMAPFCNSKKYVFDLDEIKNSLGFYCRLKKHQFIYIRNNIPLRTKLWVLMHEKGHYICEQKKCSCLNKTQIHEEHATAYALKYLLENEYSDSLFYYMVSMTAMTERKNYILYAKTYNKIIKTKLWGKCCDYLDQRNMAKCAAAL